MMNAVAGRLPTEGEYAFRSSISKGSLNRMEIRTSDDRDIEGSRCGRWRWAGLSLSVCLVSTMVILLPNKQYNYASSSKEIVHFQCPTREEHQTFNADGKMLEMEYSAATEQLTSNMTEFLATFHNVTFDEWGYTYEEIKAGMFAWKSKHFPPNVNEGDSIYESACGIGMNLYMTMEILHEVKGLENIIVYGNEYVEVSANTANIVFDRISPFRTVKGTICPGDSTDLYFVPSDSFDLVYTGYISPLMNPLNWNVTSTEGIDPGYKKLCETAGEDVEANKSYTMAQEAQEHFYAKWVSEMIRIAKPGKAVIIEQVSFPYCSNFRDWGGVPKEFWSKGIDKYKWDIAPDSLDMDDDVLFLARYHVFMRKNPAP